MSRLRRAWIWWVFQTSRTETVETMAIFRIGVGIALVWTTLTPWLSGAVDLAWTDVAHGGYRELGATWLVTLLGGPTPGVVQGLMALSVAAGVLVTLGLGGRASALVALQSFLPLTRLNTHAGGSFEHLLTNALWLLVLCRASATWSLDCRLRRGAWSSDDHIGSWARWLVLAQIVLVYGSTGLQKGGSAWTPLGGFSAVYFALRDPAWHRWDLPWLGWVSPLLTVSTAAVWLFETGWFLVPLLLWWRVRPDTGGRLGALVRRRDPRPLLLAFGAALHGGIFVLMEVGTFSWLTMCFYVALWSPSELRAAMNALMARRRARMATRASESPAAAAMSSQDRDSRMRPRMRARSSGSRLSRTAGEAATTSRSARAATSWVPPRST